MSRRIALLVGVLCALTLLLPRRAGAQEAVEYYATDAIGSVRVVFALNGTVKGRMDFGPYGEQLTTAEGIGQKVFAQTTFDGESAMDNAEARMFQPRTGRFNAPDPVFDAIEQPQAWNRYAYALNSPVVFIDSTGLQAANCVYKEIATDQGIVGTVKCTESTGGGSGASLYQLMSRMHSQPAERTGDSDSDAGSRRSGQSLATVAVALPAALAEPTPIGELLIGAVGVAAIVQGAASLIFNADSSQTGAKAPGKPGAKDGFVEGKDGGPWVKAPRSNDYGWRAADRAVWVPTGLAPGRAHGGPHWDIQYPNGGYDNMYPGGRRRPGRR